MKVYAVILAGGSGTRLWPLVRLDRPKPFVPLLGGRTLFSAAWSRAVGLAGRSRVLVVCGAEHAAWVRRQAPGLPARNIIRESVGRNTTGSIALAASRICKDAGDAVMVVMPADHQIRPAAAFSRTIRSAVRAASGSQALVTIGITPRSAESGYGWIRVGRRSIETGVFKATGFVEKPRPALARRLLRSRRHLWNSGIFVWKSSAILGEITRWEPRTARAASGWAAGAGQARAVPARVMRAMPARPIDKAVLERSRNILVAQADFQWSDLGTWDALAAELDRPHARDHRQGEQLSIDASGCASLNPGGLTVFVGARDLFAVRSGEIVLICQRSAAQQVRRIGAALRGRLARYRSVTR